MSFSQNLRSFLPILRFTIHEDSMLPTLKPGNEVLVLRFRKGQIGNIVVAKVGKRFVIKRIKRIEADRYYLIGDNHEKSTDSRKFGPVNKNDIVGTTFYIRR